MKIKRAYKIRIYPNKAQEKELIKILEGCRFVWNYFLDKRKDHYLKKKKTIPYAVMSRELTRLRKEATELSGIQLMPLAQSLRRLDTAYNRFFSKHSSFPNYKNEYNIKRSFQKPKDWRFVDDKLKIQQDIVVKYKGTVPPKNATCKTLTVSFVARSKWYASIVVEEEIKIPKTTKKQIGIDLGINALATTSEGKKYDSQKYGYEYHTQIARLQRKLKKQEVGSQRREKTKVELARAYHRIANKRMNHTHQTTNEILKKKPNLVAVETLAVKNMMKSKRLARSIAEVSWGEFLRQMKYKSEWRGTKLVEIDRFFPSSKTCHKCHYVLDKLPLHKREWDCPECKTHHDRDINAAKVILQQGTN